MKFISDRDFDEYEKQQREAFIDYLRKRMREEGLSKYQVAKYTGVKYTTIARLLARKNNNPTMRTISRIKRLMQ
jgi:transcriptional regulator with XRE-family HTH domain